MGKRDYFKIVLILVTIISIVMQNTDRSYALGEETLIIGGDKNFPPYEFVGDDGEYKGFNIDLMRALGLELGKDIKFIPMDWLEAHGALMNGDIDMIQGMNFNPQREDIYDFSSPYLLNSSVLFVRKDERKNLKLEDFKGKIVAVQRGDFTAYILAEQGEIEVKFITDLKSGFMELLEGNIDAIFSNKFSAMYILNEYKLKNQVKIVGNEINQMDYGIAFKKGNDELVKEINDALRRIKRNGIYNKIYEKWFGTFTDNKKDQRIYIYILLILVLIILVYSLISRKWNKELRREVESRTLELFHANKELILSKNLVEENNSFKEQIINSLSTGLITFDHKECITAINIVGAKTFDIPRDYIIGKSFTQLGLDKFFDIKYIRECIELDKQTEIEETIFNLKNKSLYYNYLISPLKGYEYVNSGGVMTFRNITNEKKLRIKSEEQRRMEYLGRLVTNIVHEIRNPLTSIKAYLDMLPTKYDNERFREKISQQVPIEINRLNELLNELLEYAKPPTIIKSEINLKELIIEIMDLLDNSYKDKNIDFRIYINSNLYIFGDRNKLKQVFINLILNSIESIETKGSIIICGKWQNENIKVDIIDNGKGIDKDRLDKIFEPFYTTKESGTGLGLAISYQYIKNNHGTIKIFSERNKGTTASIYFQYKERGD